MKVGVDLIEIARIERALERYPRFRERCFTEAEIAYCDSRAKPAESYAGRFAGKEAVGRPGHPGCWAPAPGGEPMTSQRIPADHSATT